jgi:hypothetical protein
MSIDTRPGAARRGVRNTGPQHARTPSAQRSILAPVPASVSPASVSPVSAMPGSAPSVSVASVDMIRAGVVETAAHEELVLERLTPNVLRVSHDERVLGFVEHVGRVHVALAGPHYDRAVEVAQTLDVAAAARALA